MSRVVYKGHTEGTQAAQQQAVMLGRGQRQGRHARVCLSIQPLS